MPPMSDAMPSEASDLPVNLPGFLVDAVVAFQHGRWYRGRQVQGSSSLLLRRIHGVRFCDVINGVARPLEQLDTGTVGIASPLAVVVAATGRIVAGAAAKSSGIVVDVDRAYAQTLNEDALADVWVMYGDSGEDVFADAATNPERACERLAAVAALLDRIEGGHGLLDAAALRATPDGPLVLAVGLAQLEAARHGLHRETAAWRTVAPERFLPPGLPSCAGDQYAIAALWVYARTGRMPYEAESAEELIKRKLTAPPSTDPLPAAERDVVARALRGDADQRFASCEDFVTALSESLTSSQPLNTATALARTQAATSGEETPFREETPPRGAAADVCDPGDVGVTAGLPPSPPRPSVAAQPHLATPPYRSGDAILEGYQLVERLGKGGFGEVWKAEGPGGSGVAIKVIGGLGCREGVREFRGLQTVKDLRHPNIVSVVGVWLKTAEGRVLNDAEMAQAIDQIVPGAAVSNTLRPQSTGPVGNLELIVVMTLGDENLHQKLKGLKVSERSREGGLEPRQLLEWMDQAAQAIDHFNRGHGNAGRAASAVQHCDIKPANMLLVGNAVQVCDFGLARDQGDARLTGSNFYSLAYCAPETMVQPYEPSPSTDQYSLAVSYYELRTGRLPYGLQPSVSPAELTLAKTSGTIDVSLVPSAEQRILRQALSLAPAKRFGSCREFVDHLADAFPGEASARQPFPWLATGLSVGGLIGAVFLVSALLHPSNVEAITRDAESAIDSMALRDFEIQGLDEAKEAIEKMSTLSGAADAAQEVGEKLEGRVNELRDELRIDVESKLHSGGTTDPKWFRAVVEWLRTDSEYGDLADVEEKVRNRLRELKDAAWDKKGYDDVAAYLTSLDRLRDSRPPRDKDEWEDVVDLAWFLACGHGEDAESRAVEVAQRAYDYAVATLQADEKLNAQDTLAAAYARQGDFTRASREIDEVLKEAERENLKKDGQTLKKDDYEKHKTAFQNRKPWDDPGE